MSRASTRLGSLPLQAAEMGRREGDPGETAQLTSPLHMLAWKTFFFFFFFLLSAVKPKVPEGCSGVSSGSPGWLPSGCFIRRVQSQAGWWHMASHVQICLKNTGRVYAPESSQLSRGGPRTSTRNGAWEDSAVRPFCDLSSTICQRSDSKTQRKGQEKDLQIIKAEMCKPGTF